MFHKKLSEKQKGQMQNQSLKQQLQNQMFNQQQSIRIPQEMYQSQNIENIINRQLLNEKIKVNPVNVRNSMNNQKQIIQYLNQQDTKQKPQYQIQVGPKQLKSFNQQQQASDNNRYKDLHLKNLSNKYQQSPMKYQDNGQNINLSQLINQIKNSDYDNKPTQNSKNPSGQRLKDFQDQKMTQVSQQSQTNQIGKKDFEFQHVVGKGGFGKVWKVVSKKTKKVYAMKDMMKSKIIVKKSVHSVMNERHLLTGINNEFIVNMQCAFQDKENLYLVMDYLPGGDLRYHIGRTRRFNELQTKFFTACLLLALQDLHKNNIIHRDIKPENLVLDRRGYMRVTDLGIARVRRDENYQDTSGTPGYMAPEVMCRQNHSFEVDYFALGVIIYEFMLGRRPYYGRNRKEIRDQMIAKQVQINYQEKPDGWSNDAVDICNALLQRKPQQRLGFEGIQEIIGHPWYSNLNWNKLRRKDLPSPYLPTSKENNFDPRQLQSSETDEEVEEQNYILLRKPQMQNMFNGYYFEMKEEQQQQQKKNQSVISTNITGSQNISNPSNS